jgi:hypothetical protein
VDIGTAQGDLAAQIALANPHLRGSGADLSEVAPIFEEYVKATGVADRVAFVACDFFKQEIPKADVVLMGHILHDWDLATSRNHGATAFMGPPLRSAHRTWSSVCESGTWR